MAVPGERVAVIVDTETAGLDHTRDEIKEIVKLRKQDQNEHDSPLDVYMRAMDEAGPPPIAEAV
jgi:uncharacterized protein (UPF0335 family)